MTIEKQDFEIIGIDCLTKTTYQYSVCASTTTEAKEIIQKRKPRFDIKIVYPSKFDSKFDETEYITDWLNNNS